MLLLSISSHLLVLLMKRRILLLGCFIGQLLRSLLLLLVRVLFSKTTAATTTARIYNQNENQYYPQQKQQQQQLLSVKRKTTTTTTTRTITISKLLLSLFVVTDVVMAGTPTTTTTTQSRIKNNNNINKRCLLLFQQQRQQQLQLHQYRMLQRQYQQQQYNPQNIVVLLLSYQSQKYTSCNKNLFNNDNDKQNDISTTSGSTTIRKRLNRYVFRSGTCSSLSVSRNSKNNNNNIENIDSNNKNVCRKSNNNEIDETTTMKTTNTVSMVTNLSLLSLLNRLDEFNIRYQPTYTRNDLEVLLLNYYNRNANTKKNSQQQRTQVQDENEQQQLMNDSFTTTLEDENNNISLFYLQDQQEKRQMKSHINKMKNKSTTSNESSATNEQPLFEDKRVSKLHRQQHRQRRQQLQQQYLQLNSKSFLLKHYSQRVLNFAYDTTTYMTSKFLQSNIVDTVRKEYQIVSKVSKAHKKTRKKKKTTTITTTGSPDENKFTTQIWKQQNNDIDDNNNNRNSHLDDNFTSRRFFTTTIIPSTNIQNPNKDNVVSLSISDTQKSSSSSSSSSLTIKSTVTPPTNTTLPPIIDVDVILQPIQNVGSSSIKEDDTVKAPRKNYIDDTDDSYNNDNVVSTSERKVQNCTIDIHDSEQSTFVATAVYAAAADDDDDDMKNAPILSMSQQKKENQQQQPSKNIYYREDVYGNRRRRQTTQQQQQQQRDNYIIREDVYGSRRRQQQQQYNTDSTFNLNDNEVTITDDAIDITETINSSRLPFNGSSNMKRDDGYDDRSMYQSNDNIIYDIDSRRKRLNNPLLDKNMYFDIDDTYSNSYSAVNRNPRQRKPSQTSVTDSTNKQQQQQQPQPPQPPSSKQSNSRRLSKQYQKKIYSPYSSSTRTRSNFDEYANSDIIDKIGTVLGRTADRVFAKIYNYDDVDAEDPNTSTTTAASSASSRQSSTQSSSSKVYPDSNYVNSPLSSEQGIGNSNQIYRREKESKNPVFTKAGATSNWRDRLEEQLDKLLGIHDDSKYYNRWTSETTTSSQNNYGDIDEGIAQKKNDDDSVLNGYAVARGERPTKKRTRNKYSHDNNRYSRSAPWERSWNGEDNFLSLLFGGDPRNINNNKRQSMPVRPSLEQQIRKIFVYNPNETNNGLMQRGSITRFLHASIQIGLVLFSYICRWASVYNAIPQPLVVITVASTGICTVNGKDRIRNMFLSLLVLRTFGELLYSFITRSDSPNKYEDRFEEE